MTPKWADKIFEFTLISEACRDAQQTLLAAKSHEASLDTACPAEPVAALKGTDGHWACLLLGLPGSSQG